MEYIRFCQLQDDVDEVKKELFSKRNNIDYSVLSDLYSHIKISTKDAASFDDMRYLSILLRDIYHALNYLPFDRIIDYKPYDFGVDREIKNKGNIEQILDYLVYTERCYLMSIARSYCFNSLEDYDLMEECKDSALRIYNNAKKMGLNVVVKIIEPGFIYDSPLFGGGSKHCVVLINFENMPYLVDATYSQFFAQKRCILNSLGLPYFPGVNPGCFMMMNNSRRNTAAELLEKGWIPLTKENFKNYFDGFVNYYRNGLYYENTLDFSYETEYSCKDYWRFLSSQDSQDRHEAIEGLGYQTRVLKDPKMSFNKR